MATGGVDGYQLAGLQSEGQGSGIAPIALHPIRWFSRWQLSGSVAYYVRIPLMRSFLRK